MTSTSSRYRSGSGPGGAVTSGTDLSLTHPSLASAEAPPVVAAGGVALRAVLAGRAVGVVVAQRVGRRAAAAAGGDAAVEAAGGAAAVLGTVAAGLVVVRATGAAAAGIGGEQR